MPSASLLKGILLSSSETFSAPDFDIETLPPLQYQPLPDDGQAWIRLLILKPSVSREAPLVCSLASLVQGDIPYEALSYAWGSQTEQLPLIVDCLATPNDAKDEWDVVPGDPTVVSITRNLHTALLQLRHAKRFRFLWVDAVCINQDDLDEKQEQIRMMGSIYAEAGQRTVVWLGEANKDTKKVFLFVRLMTRSVKFRNMQTLHNFLAEKGITCSLWLSLCELLNRPWFHRIWTAQEICLSPRAQVVCGPYSLPWHRLERLGTSLHVPSHISDIPGNYPNSPIFPDRALFTLLFWMTREESSESTVLMLAGLASMQATDPKDKVFGILALAEQLRVKFPPLDYSMSVEQIYAVATLSWIRHLRRLSCLIMATMPRLLWHGPSWAIDWDHLPSNMAWSEIFIFDESLDGAHVAATLGSFIPEEVTPDKDNSTHGWRQLRLRGIVLGQAVIKHIRSANLAKSNKAVCEMYETPIRWLQLVIDVQESRHNSQTDGCRDLFHLIEALQRIQGRPTVGDDEASINLLKHAATVSRDFIKDESSVSAETLAQFETQLVSQHSSPKQKVPWKIWFDLCHYATDPSLRNYTLFGTVNGLIGLCQCDHMEDGDELALLAGSDFVMVLRRSGTEGEFQLVGQAYVVGLMDGKVWSENQDQVRDITLL